MGGQRWHFLICLLTYFVLLISYFNLLFRIKVLLLFHGKMIQATLTGYRQQSKLMDKSVCVPIPHLCGKHNKGHLSQLVREGQGGLGQFLRPREPGL